MKFTKYHALGNDYIVIDPKNLTTSLSSNDIKIICNRHFGVGSDGILYGPEKSDICDFSLRIFNPDSSEAEKSGNGLRIFSRYLWDESLVFDKEFSIETKGGAVKASVANDGFSVTVGMGKVRFTHEPIGEPTLKNQVLTVKGREFTYFVASVGNPHCVILLDEVNDSIAKEYGSLIENDNRFINKTNIQFMKVLNRSAIQIEIWERGAGYTLASGSSSTAAAAVARALGLCDSSIDVHMPGGIIRIDLDKNYAATMSGAVCKIFEGSFVPEAFHCTIK